MVFMLRWLAGETQPNYTPAAFFLHFGEGYKNGPAAAQKHLEFFRSTDMDFVRIQFEQLYSPQDFIQKPSDWANIKPGKLDFYEPLLVTLRELIKAEKKNPLIVMTLYSPFMCAGHLATTPMLIQHLEENPDAVARGLEIVADHQMLFVRACIKEGIDGFYMSSQGSEAKRFSRPEIFAKYIRPYDLVAMTEVAKRCPLSIVHVCDFVAPYADYNATKDYPGHVINCNVKLTDRRDAAGNHEAIQPPVHGRHGLSRCDRNRHAGGSRNRNQARDRKFTAPDDSRRRLHRRSRHRLGPPASCHRRGSQFRSLKAVFQLATMLHLGYPDRE
jgi:uroporphyrinogen decarboxylase